ncbi:hypothetical protein ACOMHN_048798 [Nucella lapillus]
MRVYHCRFHFLLHLLACTFCLLILILTMKTPLTTLTTSPSDDAGQLSMPDHLATTGSSLVTTRPLRDGTGPGTSQPRVVGREFPLPGAAEDLEESFRDAEERSLGDLGRSRDADEDARRFFQLLRKSRDHDPPEMTKIRCGGGIHNLTAGDHVRNQTVARLVSAERSGEPFGGQLLERTANCTRYLLTSGFLFARVSQEELSFPLAFSILVHKDLEQVERLLRAVYRPHNVYCLHADLKAPWHFQNGLRHLAACLPNVIVTQRSWDVTWGTMSVLEPELQCMRELLSRGTRWEYFINLTGQEFPLKTNRQLVRILRALKGANIITGSRDKMFQIRWRNPNPVPWNLTMTKGDVHVIASRQYVDYVINSRVARQLLEWLRNCFIPDESFFSTLNYNPQLGVPGSFTGPESEMSDMAFRSLKLWSFVPNTKCHGRWVRFICHFGVGDLPTLISPSSPFLIANKFSYDYQPAAYDCLEQWYFDNVGRENAGGVLSLNLSLLYQQSPFVRYRYSGPVLIW